MSSPAPTHGLFLDFETEGLVVATDLPLEIAGFLVELATLERVGDPVEVLIPLPRDEPLARVRQWPEVVRAMHRKSGLLDAVVTGEADHADAVVGNAHTADNMLMTLVQQFLPDPGRAVPLMGYGVSHMEDRGWVEKYLPRLALSIPYWQIDVSGLRRTLQMFGFECPPKVDEHRALYDIDAAHSELVSYRSIFRNSEDLIADLGMAVPR